MASQFDIKLVIAFVSIAITLTSVIGYIAVRDNELSKVINLLEQQNADMAEIQSSFKARATIDQYHTRAIERIERKMESLH